jgi:hypothetical protein
MRNAPPVEPTVGMKTKGSTRDSQADRSNNRTGARALAPHARPGRPAAELREHEFASAPVITPRNECRYAIIKQRVLEYAREHALRAVRYAPPIMCAQKPAGIFWGSRDNMEYDPPQIDPNR